MYTAFANNLSLENAIAAYRDCRAARARARRTTKHRELGALEAALVARIREIEAQRARAIAAYPILFSKIIIN